MFAKAYVQSWLKLTNKMSLLSLDIEPLLTKFIYVLIYLLKKSRIINKISTLIYNVQTYAQT